MEIHRRHALGKGVVAVALIAMVGASGGAAYYLLSQQGSQSVKFMLNFTPDAYHSPYYYGVSSGTYRDAGINLTIIPGKFGANAITAVSTGQVQFGLVDTSDLIVTLASSNITNVKIIAMVFQKDFYSVIYNEASVHTLSDLEGKSGAGSAPSSGGAATELFLLLAKENGINVSSIKLQYATPAVFKPLLVSGKIQFIVSAAHALPSLQAAAAQNGISLGEFDFANYGVSTYGLALITSDQMIQQHSALVSSFVLATMKSLQASMSDPGAAVAALTAAQPQLDYTQTLAGFQLDLNCCVGPPAPSGSPLQLGWIDATTMQQTVDTVVAGLGITVPVNASALFTDQYVSPP